MFNRSGVFIGYFEHIPPLQPKKQGKKKSSESGSSGGRL